LLSGCLFVCLFVIATGRCPRDNASALRMRAEAKDASRWRWRVGT
jgi:hypothetical protein